MPPLTQENPMYRMRTVLAGAIAVSFAATAMASEGSMPNGIPHLDHVFVIMMENHGFQQVVGNPTMPFINGLISSKQVNLATNYFAVGHPSLTNYLEVAGGSNFGVRSDNPPDWHNTSCRPNIATGIPNADNDNAPNPPPYPIESDAVCPIGGQGMDALTEAVDNWNETEPGFINFLPNIDGVKSLPAAHTVGKTIGDQLAQAGLSWKSYQENLPSSGADQINVSNGTASNLTTFNANKPLSATNLPPLTSSGILNAYAVKHNPFAYFRSVQEGNQENNSLRNMVGFDGARGLYADLAAGSLPSLSFIVPNQCDDQHGQNNADAFCAEDQGTPFFQAQGQALTDGTQVGLNPGLAAQADATVQRLVTGIKDSPAWHRGYNAIVIVYDENDYSGTATAQPVNKVWPAQFLNTVILTVETNSQFGRAGVHSKNFYNSFSLLKTLEAGFRLQCLNHACDNDVSVMSDLFGEGH
jgi:phosphatidylinositol-3-phosphatase